MYVRVADFQLSTHAYEAVAAIDFQVSHCGKAIVVEDGGVVWVKAGIAGLVGIVRSCYGDDVDGGVFDESSQRIMFRTHSWIGPARE